MILICGGGGYLVLLLNVSVRYHEALKFAILTPRFCILISLRLSVPLHFEVPADVYTFRKRLLETLRFSIFICLLVRPPG